MRIMAKMLDWGKVKNTHRLVSIATERKGRTLRHCGPQTVDKMKICGGGIAQKKALR